MKTWKRYKLDIPTEVSGRPVTSRGVHLQPFGYHGVWVDREVQDHYWTNLMKSMGISWVVALTEGDSIVENRHGTTPLEILLEAGIIPIIRDKKELPDGFTNFRTVERTVAICARYGVRPFWQLYNEPFDVREWRNRKVPTYGKAWGIIADRWSAGARRVVDAGAYVGFPDGPGYGENPFERLRAAGGLDLFKERVAFYAPHTYGLGRPVWYPYDAVSRHGAALTEEAYSRLLDDYADDPRWRDAPLSMINQQRVAWADADRTAFEDDTCWRGWEKIAWWAMQSLGEVPPMAMTEGGWTPRARAGVLPVDNRWTYSTPRMVAKKTLRMYDTPSPFFAICPWLLASEDMGGSGWPDEAWHGGSFSDLYGRAKPVIHILRARPPREVVPLSEPIVSDLDDDTRDWRWVRRTLGASYRRGAGGEALPGRPPALRLVEVQEYEGPATLDVTAVDADGLPVEGAVFYHHFPGAPPIPAPPGGAAPDEWYANAERGVTDATGRISFAVRTPPCTPGNCREAIWPEGKGDLLDHLGLLVGTHNRHLNGVWQLGAAVGPDDGGDGDDDGPPDGGGGPPDDDSGPPDGGGEPPDGGGGPVPAGWRMAIERRPGARILAGTLPEAGIAVTVTDPWGNAWQVVSGSKPEHGPGGFEVVTPHAATYTVRFLDQSFAVETHDGATFLTFKRGEGGGPPDDDGGPPDDDSGPLDGGGEPPDGGGPVPAGWRMAVERRPGARILAGILPEAGIAVTVSDPWGNAWQVVSGSKPEHGPGGFEVVAPHVATYTVRFLDQSFAVETHDGATFLTFERGEGGGPSDDNGGPPDGGGGGPANAGDLQGQMPYAHKLGFYLESTTVPGLVEAVRDCQPPVILTHANDWGFLREVRRWLAPNALVVGRLHVEPGQQDEWLDSADPAARGRDLAERILSMDHGQALARGANGRLLVDAWMSLNECLPGPASDAYLRGSETDRTRLHRRADAYDRFQVAFRQRLKQADPDIEAVAFNFGAGNFPDARDYLDRFPRTLAEYVYLGFHEYGWPALSRQLDPEAASSAGTYRTVMEGIRRRYGDRHRVIISEAGLARMYRHPRSEAGDVGWLYPHDPVPQEKYLRSLEWYNAYMAQDDYVVGCCLFTVGHSGKWESFRHLGVDNNLRPIQIVPWIRALRERIRTARPEAAAVAMEEAGPRVLAVELRGRVLRAGEPVPAARVRVVGTVELLGGDRRAAAHVPELVTWTRTVTGFGGRAWNCWQRYVQRSVAGITWEQFEAQLPVHNPSLRETGGLFEAGRTYLLPENPPTLEGQVTWDRFVSGIRGNRWQCWNDHVRGKVPGLDWATFRHQVGERNPELAGDGYQFLPHKTYVLPRSATQQLYVREAWTGPNGWFAFPALPAGDYTLEVTAEGAQPRSEPLTVAAGATLTIELE